MLQTAHRAAGGRTRNRPRWELADVFRAHGEEYRRRHRLPLTHLKVMRAVENCRTARMGGHLERCDTCGFERPAYNSCRNRHCPKCQAFAKAQWLQKRKAELLPVPYFHNVFTLPHDLNPLVLTNKKALLNLLFRTVAKTLQAFGADPKQGLGGKVGFISVLHTWDQKLLDHFHLHCLIPAGALATDGSRWIPARANFLFPVKALSRTFRGKFIEGLRRAYKRGDFEFPGPAADLQSQKGFGDLLQRLWNVEWVVYSRASFQGPERTLDYLARYTRRVAISNDRLVSLRKGQVTFRWRDRRNGNKVKQLTLSAEEFIRRFLLHVLPGRFVRIRHYGILANRGKKRDLARCRELLGGVNQAEDPGKLSTQETILKLTGIDVTACPKCTVGSLERIRELPKLPHGTRRQVLLEDSS